MILVQNWPVFHICLLGNLDQKNVFFDILERKSTILCYKNKNLKEQKNWIFPKLLVHGFDPKLGIF